ncbi:MAG: UPF0058 family protein [Candidatus Methanospirareceae archaeon]
MHLHLLLVQLKKYFEENNLGGDFLEYTRLGISPFHVHRSKEEHKKAIFTLANEFSAIVARNRFSENRNAEGRE